MGLFDFLKDGRNENDSEVPAVVVEQLHAESFVAQDNLTEIKDPDLLARVDAVIPGMLNVGINTADAVRGTSDAVYRAVIPIGAKLANSKSMEGAVRGFYHGSDGIAGHANLVEVKQGGAVAANAASAAAGLAALVVGQYYMTRINAELGEISGQIKGITDFQDAEFKSRVITLIDQIEKVSEFQMEVMENEELRDKELDRLYQMEETCIQLLNQAGLLIESTAEKTAKDYKEYEQEVYKVQRWYLCQKILIEALGEIVRLKYVLHNGNASREYCMGDYAGCVENVRSSRERLTEWHEKCMEEFDIDMDEKKRRRQGISGALCRIPGLINDDFNYKDVRENLVNLIGFQISSDVCADITMDEVYEQDVELYFKDGRLYYLAG